MLIVSGLVLNCCVFGALFRPLVEYVDDFDENDVTQPLKEKPSSKPESHKLKTMLEISVTTSIDEEDEEGEEGEEALEMENFKNGSTSLANNLNEAVDEIKSLPRHSFSVSKVNEKQNSDNFYNNIQNATSLCSVQVSVNESPIANNCERRRSFSLSPGILYRKDIFYSGSLINIPQYRSNPDFIQIPNKKRQNDCFLYRCLHCSEEMIDTFSEMLNFGLLKNAVFLIFAISNFLTSIGFFVPHIYIKVILKYLSKYYVYYNF
jgi:hypothetical protein